MEQQRPLVGSAKAPASFPLAGLGRLPENRGAVKNVVCFNLETQRSADEVGGWDKVRELRMRVGVAYSTARRGYEI